MPVLGFYVLSLLSLALGDTAKNVIPSLKGVKYIQCGEMIRLKCPLSSFTASMATWFKHTPGDNPRIIVSAFVTLQEKYHNGFDNSGRFNAVRDKSSFNLNISNAEPSDSATYYCVTANYNEVALFVCTVLVLKGTSSSHYAVLQHPISNPVQMGGDTTLQCSILTDNAAGDHSVYWFRHGSGESDPGIIYTHGNRSDQCKKSSKTDSPTQSCVYKLPMKNLSFSDTGTYYCAVAACGEIIFGKGSKLDITTGENRLLDPSTMVLAASNIILMIAVLFLCKKLHNSHQKDAVDVCPVQAACDKALMKFANELQQINEGTEEYSRVIYYQHN